MLDLDMNMHFEMILQEEINKALKPIKEKYGIDIEYCYGYNEEAVNRELKTILGYMKQITGACNLIIKKSKIVEVDWARDVLVSIEDECDLLLNEMKIEHNINKSTSLENEILHKLDLIIKRLDGDLNV